MPELPEVETVCRGLQAALKGAVIAQVTLRRKDLRVPFPPGLAKVLAGRKIRKIDRRAKYLLWHLDSEDVLVAHLGMTGRFSVVRHPVRRKAAAQDPAPPLRSAQDDGKHDHVIFELTDGRSVIFNDARRFGLMLLTTKDRLKTHKLLVHLGPEPFDKTFSPEYLKTALTKRKGPIKPALMDQSLVVGVGNIYASEALFLAGIDPRKPAYKAAGQAKEIIAAIREVLRAAIASGGSSLRDFLHVSGEAGYFQHRFKVYDREGEPCFSCGIPLQGTRQSGRATFFCAGCQK